MHVSVSSPLLFLALAIGLGLSTSHARAEGDPAPEPSSAVLREHLLSDDEINDRCAASIRARYDLVDMEDADGDIIQVPRCVSRYHSMRAVAQEYLDKEDEARREILGAITQCHVNPNQASCLESSKVITRTAIRLHQGLASSAEAAEATLAGAP